MAFAPQRLLAAARGPLLVFGAGPRACVAPDWALDVVTAVLAALLARFEPVSRPDVEGRCCRTYPCRSVDSGDARI